VQRIKSVGRPRLDARERALLDEPRAWPRAVESFSDSPHSNVIKDTYDYSCFLARWNEGCHLMT
jgi:hypothetical protein